MGRTITQVGNKSYIHYYLPPRKQSGGESEPGNWLDTQGLLFSQTFYVAKWLDNIEYWLNNTTHQSTGFTPTQIMTDKIQPLQLDKFLTLL